MARFRKRDLRKMDDAQKSGGKKKSWLAIRRQKEHGESLREWLQERGVQAGKAAKMRAEELRNQPRGVDRVPDWRRVNYTPPEPIITHMDANYSTRRREALNNGSRNMRADGRWVKGQMRGGLNQPHNNPARGR